MKQKLERRFLKGTRITRPLGRITLLKKNYTVFIISRRPAS